MGSNQWGKAWLLSFSLHLLIFITAGWLTMTQAAQSEQIIELELASGGGGGGGGGVGDGGGGGGGGGGGSAGVAADFGDNFGGAIPTPDAAGSNDAGPDAEVDFDMAAVAAMAQADSSGQTGDSPEVKKLISDTPDEAKLPVPKLDLDTGTGIGAGTGGGVGDSTGKGIGSGSGSGIGDGSGTGIGSGSGSGVDSGTGTGIGSGSGSGIGSGSGRGVGSGSGSGIGSGSGSGIGSGSGSGIGAGNMYGPSVLREVKPQYPEQARQARQEGTVVLRIQILVNGNPGAISVSRSSGYASLDEAAMTAVAKWRFVPAKDAASGRPIACYTTMPVVFRLR